MSRVFKVAVVTEQDQRSRSSKDPTGSLFLKRAFSGLVDGSVNGCLSLFLLEHHPCFATNSYMLALNYGVADVILC